jgi:phytoene dehydrogenase-like protein
MVRRARQTVFDKLVEIGITDLEENIEFEVVYSQKEWEQLYNLDKGSAFGLSHDFWQVGYLRPQNRHAHFKNLYFTGASTHPGTGLPIVLLSARLVAERIADEQITS